MKYLISFLCLFASKVAFGQVDKSSANRLRNVDATMTIFLDSLKQTDTDFIIAVSRVIQGIQPMDTIGIPSYREIFWLNKSNTYYLEMRGYSDHDVVISKPKSLTNSTIFSFLKNNYDSIKEEIILPFITKHKINGIDNYDVLRALHGGFNKVYIITKNGETSKEFEDYDLQENFGGVEVNLNSAYINNSKFKKLWDLLWTAITNEWKE